MKKRNPLVNFLINNGLYIVLVAMFIYFAATSESFRSLENLANIPEQIAFITLIAIGMTFVIITAGIDLSVGSIVALAAVIFAIFVEKQGMAIPLAIAAALILGSMSGVISGFFVIRFKVPPFIATLAMMTIARGVARNLAQNTKIFISTEDIDFYTDLITRADIGGVSALVFFTIFILIVFGLILLRTRFGRYVIAIGGNEEASRLSGVNVGAVKLYVYIIVAALSSLVGIMMACKFTNGNPEFGVMWELDAIAACVVGGTSLMGGKGNVFKTFLGALLIGVLDNGLLAKGLSSEMIYIIKGIIILGAVLIDQVKEN